MCVRDINSIYEDFIKQANGKEHFEALAERKKKYEMLLCVELNAVHLIDDDFSEINFQINKWNKMNRPK